MEDNPYSHNYGIYQPLKYTNFDIEKIDDFDLFISSNSAWFVGVD